MSLSCKYCGNELSKVLLAPDNDWGVEFLMICLNDDCSYYQRGWNWMKEKYNVAASYRYKIDVSTGIEGPIPVISPGDFKNQVVLKFVEQEKEK